MIEPHIVLTELPVYLEWDILVYGWRRNNIYLYIGSTGMGLRRIKNNSKLKFETGDEIHLWAFRHIADAREFERQLIFKIGPKLNIAGNLAKPYELPAVRKVYYKSSDEMKIEDNREPEKINRDQLDILAWSRKR